MLSVQICVNLIIYSAAYQMLTLYVNELPIYNIYKISYFIWSKSIELPLIVFFIRYGFSLSIVTYMYVLGFAN